MRRMAFLPALYLMAASAAAPAAEAGGLQAGLSWRLEFGGSSPLAPAYRLALGYRLAEPGAPAARVLELDVSRRAAAARLAGLPLGVAPGRLEAAAAHGAADPEAPAEAWYARPWVYWTVGGLAATAALAGGGGNRESATYSARTGNACVLSGNAGDTEIPATCAPQTGDTGCVDGTACVACDNSVVTDDCRGGGWASRSGRGAPAPARDPVHEAWLDAGTGHMGDLLPR